MARPGAWCDIEFRDREVQRMMSGIIRRGGDLRTPLTRLSAHMEHSTAETARVEGRPTRWKPLSPVTIARRRKGKKGMGAIGGRIRILQDTGLMMQSVTARARGSLRQITRSMLRFGTTVKYAAKHQFGDPGGQRIQEQVRASRRAIIARGGRTYARWSKVKAFTRTVTTKPIPIRKFLNWLRGDVTEAGRLIGNYWVEAR